MLGVVRSKNMNILFLVCVNVFCVWRASEATVISVESLKKETTKVKELQKSLGDPSQFDIENLVKAYGYPFEKHPVTTEDGYKLEMHRIPHGTADSDSEVKPAVLIMHDILGTSADFLISGPKHSLALELADQGYDVWLGNNRGNTWSRGHETLDLGNKTFWDFSFHELGIFDNPAMIDYILDVTKQSKLSYIGFSQGATQFFVTMSEKPEYNDKITVMNAMAPLVYMKNANNIIFRLLSDKIGIVESLEKFLDIEDFLPHNSLISTVGDILCKNGSIFQEICSTVMSVIVGFNKNHTNNVLLPNLLKVFPGGSSLKEFKHYAQGISSGAFRQYNYGVIKNAEKYNNLTPPAYNLTKVTVPVAIFHGENDWLVNVTDVGQLAKELPNVAKTHTIEDEEFNHGDFLYGGVTRRLVNFHVINTLNGYNNKSDITTTEQTPPSAGTTQTKTTSTGSSETTNTGQTTASNTTSSISTDITPASNETTNSGQTTASSVIPQTTPRSQSYNLSPWFLFVYCFPIFMCIIH